MAQVTFIITRMVYFVEFTFEVFICYLIFLNEILVLVGYNSPEPIIQIEIQLFYIVILHFRKVSWVDLIDLNNDGHVNLYILTCEPGFDAFWYVSMVFVWVEHRSPGYLSLFWFISDPSMAPFGNVSPPVSSTCSRN